LNKNRARYQVTGALLDKRKSSISNVHLKVKIIDKSNFNLSVGRCQDESCSLRSVCFMKSSKLNQRMLENQE